METQTSNAISGSSHCQQGWQSASSVPWGNSHHSHPCVELCSSEASPVSKCLVSCVKINDCLSDEVNMWEDSWAAAVFVPTARAEWRCNALWCAIIMQTRSKCTVVLHHTSIWLVGRNLKNSFCYIYNNNCSWWRVKTVSSVTDSRWTSSLFCWVFLHSKPLIIKNNYTLTLTIHQQILSLSKSTLWPSNKEQNHNCNCQQSQHPAMVVWHNRPLLL